MFIHHEEPDATRPDLLERLDDTLKDTLDIHMFLTQPPVSRVHATWKYGQSNFDMELNNNLGVRVEDLIEHLEEFGRTSDGGKVVGMDLMTLFVHCAGRQRLRTYHRVGRRTRKEPYLRLNSREMWVDENEAVNAAMDY